MRRVLLLDKHQDTILCGDVLLDLSRFNYSQHTLSIDKVTLNRVTAKIIQYKNDSTFNYHFISEFFKSADTTKSASKPWDVKFGDFVFQDVHLVYKREKYVEAPSHNINFDDIDCRHVFGTVSQFKVDGDTMSAQLIGLRLEEKSGLQLKNLTTQCKTQ